MLHTTMTAQHIDDVLAGTFPASDPPSWTPGIARPAPEIHGQAASAPTRRNERNHVPAGVVDVSSPAQSTRTCAQALRSAIGGVGLALLVPFVILAITVPVGLGVRGVVEAAEWLLTIIR